MATSTIQVVRPKRSPVLPVKNVLFATDSSEYSRQALPYVTGLARKSGSKVFLCRVVASSELNTSAPEAAPCLHEDLRRKSVNELLDMTRSQELEELNVTTLLASGNFEDEVSEAINENQIDLVIVGTSGHSGIRQLVRDSAKPIWGIAPCPVLTVGPSVRPTEEVRFDRILVPTDFSEETSRILPHVRDIARSYGSSITFLHVIRHDAVLNAVLNIDAHTLANEVRRRLHRAFAAECADHRPEVLIEFGDPAWAIVRAARENKADLIAMGIKKAAAVGMNASSGIVYQVRTGARCPVLTCV